MPELTDELLEFYGRHLMLGDIGIEGQARLGNATVTLVGAGGIGCPAALYLASGGVGTLQIVDDDLVEAVNLQRQLLYRYSDIGQPKAAAAAAALGEINPAVKVVAICERADPSNLAEFISASSVVLDGTDNFASRHAINRACHAAEVNLVSGAAEQWDGQVCTFAFAQAKRPCYNCLFPDAMPLPDATSCATLGVFAPLTGLVGALMASEALRIVAQVPSAGLQAQMLAFDIRDMRTRTVAIQSDKKCQVCCLID